jgi:hypothetical protein
VRVQPFVTVLQIEKSRLAHLTTPRFTRSSRRNLNPIPTDQGRPIFRGALNRSSAR